ncbi:hypothetical protein QKW55_13445 [Bacillus paralicheniformis]|nr:hypothetical protein QKW55_13445 [Bacillus paralicheniformis]
MRRFAAVLICLAVAMVAAGCQNEDEGKDRRLVAVEGMLEAILNDDVSKMKRLYVEGATPLRKQSWKTNRNGEFPGFVLMIFKFLKRASMCFMPLTRWKIPVSPERSRFGYAMIQIKAL